MQKQCSAAAATFEPFAFLQLCDEETGLLHYPDKKGPDEKYQCATCRGATLPLSNKAVTMILMVLNAMLTPFLLLIHAVKIYVVPCIMIYDE